MGYLETSEYLLSGGGGGGGMGGFWGSHMIFSGKEGGAGESSPTEYDDGGGDYRD